MSQTYAELSPDVQALFPPLVQVMNYPGSPVRIVDAFIKGEQYTTPDAVPQFIVAVNAVNFATLSEELQTFFSSFTKTTRQFSLRHASRI